MTAPFTRFAFLLTCSVFLGLSLTFPAAAKFAAIEPAPDRSEGEGPFDRLILSGGILVDGTGAPAVGPVDILIEGDRIARIASSIDAGDKDRVLDIAGMYVLPGFVDMHGHIGGVEQGTPAEYVYKLWMGHGITTIRDPGSGNGLEWVLNEKRRSARNEITAPRIEAYLFFGSGHEGTISTPAAARAWVRKIAGEGAEGIKFFGAPPEVLAAALDEAGKQGLRTAMHHAQLGVTRANVMDTSRWGLTTMEHWYGLPEALFTDRTIQDYPANYNYANEYHRFAEAGRLWKQAAGPGSDRWNEVRDTLVSRDFTINPTFTIYEANRDLMAQRRAEWHEQYTLPSLWKFFTPSTESHGSYWFDWSTADEIAWQENFRRWMQFVNDYKNHGGRVTVGSDAGYIYKIYGFGYVQELELLQEAGFHPLEVVRAATLHGAEALGMASEIGSIEPGKLADLVVVDENPLRNFKVLYGTGAIKLNDEGEVVRAGGVRWTIKDGIIYDAPKLLEDVRKIVKKSEEANGITELRQPGM